MDKWGPAASMRFDVPLQPDASRWASLVIPGDLALDEAERLCGIIMAIAAPDGPQHAETEEKSGG